MTSPAAAKSKVPKNNDGGSRKGKSKKRNKNKWRRQHVHIYRRIYGSLSSNSSTVTTTLSSLSPSSPDNFSPSPTVSDSPSQSPTVPSHFFLASSKDSLISQPSTSPAYHEAIVILLTREG
ncbi:hypothetical protein MTR_8g094635 [Medicago truncatula]|nr:hypothetical protein MTR_8g094635 [Medicago truncatula]